MTSRLSPSQARPRLRVAVASDYSLVAESVAAALGNRGFDPVVVQWPHGGPPGSRPRRLRVSRRSAGPPPEVGLVVTDLEHVAQVHAAAALATALRVPWLVLAGVPSGAAWGGLYARGVTLVVESDTSLDEVCRTLTELAAGQEPAGQRQRRELVRAWNDFSEHRDELASRLGRLTGREEEVLRQLHDGLPVRAIAEQSAVTESTVRSQVKAILRKLGVSSQLAAVAAYELVRTDSTSVVELQ